MRDSIKLEKILGARNGNVLKIHGVEATILVVRVVVVIIIIIIIIIIIVRGRGAVVIIPTKRHHQCHHNCEDHQVYCIKTHSRLYESDRNCFIK